MKYLVLAAGLVAGLGCTHPSDQNLGECKVICDNTVMCRRPAVPDYRCRIWSTDGAPIATCGKHNDISLGIEKVCRVNWTPPPEAQ